MKLLFIGNVGYRVNSFVFASAEAAKRLGIEFHVAGAWTGYGNLADKLSDEEQYGIRIHQIDFVRTPYNPKNIKAYKQVVELIKKEHIDVIHCNTPIGGVVGRLAGKKCGIKPVIYQAHGFHFYDGAPLVNWALYYPIEKWLAHFTDVLITINKEDYKRAQNKIHLRNCGNVYHVPGVGIDTSEMTIPEETRIKKRKSLGIPQNAIVLISVGDINANKNNAIIINALKKMCDMDVHYILCGEGVLKNELEQASSPISNRVHFLGYRTDVKEWLAASDIFVLPSKREGLSRSLMEAMVLGLPCIVSSIRGNNDLIDNNKGGILCSPNEIDDYIKAISLLSNNSGIRLEMGDYNKIKVEAFSFDTVTNIMEKIYSRHIINTD